jgi:Ca2+-binding RTX toxin-like protein
MPTDPTPVPTPSEPETPEVPEAPAGANDIVLKVSGDQFDGAPTFDVKVDGVTVAAGLKATADHNQGQWAEVKVEGDFSNAKTVEVTFTNDLWGGSLQADRNLYVDKIMISDKVVQAEASNVTGTAILQGSDVFLRSSGDSVSFALSSGTPTEPTPEPAPTDPTPTDPGTTPVEIPTFTGSNFTGTNTADTIIGNEFANKILGGGGNDVIKGGAGSDHIDGGSGADQMWGGSDNDAFAFSSVNAANGDQIMDFATRDIIDLSAIDAQSRTKTNEAFQFIGTDAFSGAGQLHIKQDAASGVTYIEGNTNNDPAADFVIIVKGLHAFAASDFHL